MILRLMDSKWKHQWSQVDFDGMYLMSSRQKMISGLVVEFDLVGRSRLKSKEIGLIFEDRFGLILCRGRN